MNILTEAQALAVLNLTRSASFQTGLRPLMQAEKDAVNLSAGRRSLWVYDADRLRRWAEYVKKRQALIGMGKWSKTRPWSLADLVALVDDGVYDGELDHPAFRVANNE